MYHVQFLDKIELGCFEMLILLVFKLAELMDICIKGFLAEGKNDFLAVVLIQIQNETLM